MKKYQLLFFILFLSATTLYAQTHTVNGKVSEESGGPVSGATVTLVGTPTVSITDIEGKFSIAIPDKGNPQLRFTSVGYVGQTYLATDGLSIVLVKDVVSAGDEVVVVGYQSVKRKDLTGAVSSVSDKQLKDIPLSSAAEVLTGKLAGVVAQSSEGSPGAEVTIRVRGGGSITQDNSPIYIVDGVQMENALSFISPSEIKSVDVLKDAASTAIYGARGANGVIIITTKSGANMPTKVSYDAFYGARKIVNKLDVLQPYDFVMYQYQIYNYNTDQPTKDAFTSRYGNYQDLDIYKNMPFKDWQQALFGNAAMTFNQSLSVAGGSKNTTFNISLNRVNEDGIMISSGFKRTMASFKLDHRISDKFRVAFNSRYSEQTVIGVGTSNTGTQSNSRLRNAVRYQPFESVTSPYVDAFDPDYANATNLTNPVLLANAQVQNSTRKDLLLNGIASFNILKNLQLRSVLGLTPTTTTMQQFNGTITGVARQNNNQPVVVLQNSTGLTITNSNTLAYNTTFKKSRFDVLAGQEIYQTNTDAQSMTIKWLPVDITASEAFHGYQKATPPDKMIQDAPSTGNSGSRLLSFFGRANYAYEDKYLATVTMRRDGSSLFAPANRWGNFPSMALAWRASNEAFIKPLLEHTPISDLKVRFSFGSVGNNRIAQDQWLTLLGTGSDARYSFNESVLPGYASTSYANPDLKWETTISRNLGFDFGFLNNRFTATVDLYQNSVKDLLIQATVPQTTGYTTQYQNIGRTQNKGIEIQVGGDMIRKKDFTWTSNFNIASNKNKVLSLGMGSDGKPKGSMKFSSGWITGSTWDYLVQVGKPLGQIYGFVSDGYYKIEDFDYDASSQKYTLKAGIANDATMLGNKQPQPGDMKLKKTTSTTDMNIGEDDKTVIGNTTPKFTGGWNNQFVYKNFDMSVFVNWSYGNKVYNANRIEFTGQYLYKDNNLLSIMKDRWKWFDDAGNIVKDPTQLAALNKDTKYWTPAGGQYAPTSFAVEDGSFLRINNITIGYSLPARMLTKTKFISRVRFFGTVNNLYTFTKYSGFDPEANTRRSSPLTPGVDYAAYPRNRFILGGINVTFN
ncbi:MAG: TonB-dependent receptor [Niabella sp.]|nr:TonB-dependent receptor [Niabella sp.]